MRLFGLTPEAVVARTAASDLRPPAAPGHAMAYGAVTFAAVSVLAYSIWAFHWVPGTGAMYGAIAAVYLGLSGVALSRLVAGRGAMSRFALLFAAAFLIYAIAWCAFWFGLKGKHHADLWGSVVGLAGMTWLMQRAFGGRGDFLAAFAILFTFHTLGYFAGDVLHAIVPGATGRLLWGVAYGSGFGAGLGALISRCQLPLKNQLRSAAGR